MITIPNEDEKVNIFTCSRRTEPRKITGLHTRQDILYKKDNLYNLCDEE
jgi:hypothetical protein